MSATNQNPIDTLIETKIVTSLTPVVEHIGIMEQKMAAIAEKAGGSATVQKLEVKLINSGKTKKVDTPHFLLETLLKCVNALPCNDRNFYAWGDAGSGKSFVMKQLQEALELDYYTMPKPTMAYDIFGNLMVDGSVYKTQFRKCWENGGLILIDEFHAIPHQLTIMLNEALANGTCAFPDGMVKRHANCIIAGTGNSNLRGGTSKYKAGISQDVSTTDRLVMLRVDYCENFERATFNANPDWTLRVQKLRAIAKEEKLDNIFTITPRAMIKGAYLLEAGFTQNEVEEMLIIQGGPEDATRRLIQKCGKSSTVKGKVINQHREVK
jgi:hypothetical protein